MILMIIVFNKINCNDTDKHDNFTDNTDDTDNTHGRRRRQAGVLAAHPQGQAD